MPEQSPPLEELVRILRSRRPPSIDVLLSVIEDHQHYAEFIRMVKELLPEREKQIIQETTVEDRIAKFASYFEDRYFPLPMSFKDGETETYYDLVCHLPLIPLGFGYQDYDNLIEGGYPGYRLMTYIFRQPYDDQGARVALGEACAQDVPAELLKRIPEPGFTPEEMHNLLDCTPYKALAMWGDAISLNTGNELLDTDEGMMYNSELPEWSRENVDYFTRKWQEAEKYQQATGDMSDIFDTNAETFLREVLDFIDKRKEVLHDQNAAQGANSLPVGIA